MMKILRSMMIMVFALIGSLAIAQRGLHTASKASTAHAGSLKIEWLTWDQAVAKMDKQPRKMMVDVYTEWCGWCKRMDATTMEDPAIVKLIGEKFYAVKLDRELRKDIVFRGRTYKFISEGSRGHHELPAELLSGRMSYPTLVFLDEDYGIIQPLPGYQDVATLEPILAYFGGGHYKTTPWGSFQASYKSTQKYN
jgi:thioredoxin-related protein